MATHCTIITVARREYKINLMFNEQQIVKVIIDNHFEGKHSDSIDDQIIFKLVSLLDGQIQLPEDSDPPYSYFVKDGIELNGKKYKLIWLLEDSCFYIGVINAYRR